VVAAVEKLVSAHHLGELVTRKLGESPVLRLDDKLTSRELHRGREGESERGGNDGGRGGE
jgi:hypothetical protein